jgi:hypothetical protein
MAMRRILLSLLCLAAPSLAGAGEMRLAWNECAGAGGAHTLGFACNTNSNAQARSLVVSFIPPPGVTTYVGNDVVLDIMFDDPVTPSWWAVRGTGQCRNNAAIGSADFAGGPYGCTDLWVGQAVGGIASYNIAYVAANRARMQLAFAVQTALAQPLDENLEYYACKITILNTKTVGTGSCAGCASPAALFVSDIRLHQLPGDGDVSLGTSFTAEAIAGWQCPASFSVCDGPGCGLEIHPDCTTPVRNPTWGMIKAAYR